MPDISELLAEEINSFGQFCLLLQEEREALASMDQNALDLLIKRKQILCEQLSRLAEQRQAQLGDNLPSKHPELAADWQRLMALAGEARQLNRINGTIIDVRMQHNQQAMALLQTGEEITSTYSADGSPRAASNARHLGSA